MAAMSATPVRAAVVPLAAGVARCILLFSAAVLAPAGQCASKLEDDFTRLGTQTVALRTMTLADLGIKSPIVLQGANSRRDLYLPVPPGVPISDARIQFNARYLRPDPAATSLVLSLDNDAVSARSLSQQEGDASVTVGVDGSARANGFVQFTVQWPSVAAACAAGGTVGNTLYIQPDTRFSYRYDNAAIRTLPSAWNALPSAPVILVAGKSLAAASYDTAWRVGVTLARSGRQPVVRALPQPGDQIDLAGIEVPASLRGIPAFDTLARGGRHTIGSQAEVGALLALGAAGPLHADLLVADQALQAKLNASVEALGEDVRQVTGSESAFLDWKTRHAAALVPASPQEVRLLTLAGRAVILLGPSAGQRAAALFEEARHPAGTPGRLLASAKPGAAPELPLPVAQLGGYVGSFEVAARGEWQANFKLAAVAHGRAPTDAVIDVSAAPLAPGQPLTASVLFNDILLGSQRVDGDSRPHRLAVRIPRYAQLAHNTLRVVFQRPGSDCQSAARGALVSILPTSHVVFRHQDAADDFIGMTMRLSADANLIVPRGYLDDAPTSLGRVTYIAEALGVAPQKAAMLVSERDPIRPSGPFLAFDPASVLTSEERKSDGVRPLLASYRQPGQDQPAELGYGALKVIHAGDQPGIVYYQLGATAPQFSKPFQLAHGALALLGDDGVLAELDADGVPNTPLTAEAASAWWRGALWWLLPCFLVLLFIGLLVVASYVRRRQERLAAQQKGAG
jgi:hypothetical protein